MICSVGILLQPADATDTLCGLVVKQLCGGELDYEILSSVIKGGALNESDAKGVLAALNYILSNACKYGVTENELHIETQQLGLTKDSADKIAARYVSHSNDLTAVKSANTLRLGGAGAVQWRVDCIIGSSMSSVGDGSGGKGGDVSVQMKMGTAPAFEVSSDMFRLLHSELAAAQEQMNDLPFV